MGFVRLWAECLIVRPCTMTIVALTFAKYAVKLFFPECQPPDESVRLLAAACICKFQESSSGPSCNPGLRQTNARGLGPSFENVNKCRLLWHSQYVIIPVYVLICGYFYPNPIVADPDQHQNDPDSQLYSILYKYQV